MRPTVLVNAAGTLNINPSEVSVTGEAVAVVTPSLKSVTTVSVRKPVPFRYTSEVDWTATAFGNTGLSLLSTIGASQGLLSIVLIASAVFPLIAVALSIGFLHERPVANQYLGIALVVAGLLVLGLA